jgi:hypothetical protein
MHLIIKSVGASVIPNLLLPHLKFRNNYEHQHLILSHVCFLLFLIIIIIDHNFYEWRWNLRRCLPETKKHLTESGEIQYSHLTVYYIEKMLF